MHFLRKSRGAGALLLLAAFAACGDSPPTAPRAIDPDRDPSIEAEQRASHSIQWNAAARALVAGRRLNPLQASRVYALLSVSQHATLIAAAGPAEAPGGARALSLGAALVAASAEVLSRLLPTDASAIAELERQDLAALAASGVVDEDIAQGEARGRRIADRVLRHASSDGSDAIWQGTVPSGAGAWYSSEVPAIAPLSPQWRHVRTWLLESPSDFRPPPPPAFGSPEFQAGLDEVRRISDTRTEEQLWIAHYWADSPGSHTPPGHWNRIATIIMNRDEVSEREATRGLALLNIALMDAGIAAWDSKFEYWVIRPWQADSGITVPLMKPNFPAYVSGHATFSGAASEFIGALFPGDAADVRAMAEEAAMSRLYGGIHYRFDNEHGLVLGRRIAQLAIVASQRSDANGPWARYLR